MNDATEIEHGIKYVIETEDKTSGAFSALNDNLKREVENTRRLYRNCLDEIYGKRARFTQTPHPPQPTQPSRLSQPSQIPETLQIRKANAEAEKQFEKDFARLSFRRDWRTAKNLTVDQEAVRRVGLAREEEAAAKKAAEETAANTARAADALEEIKAAMTEEA